MVRRGAKSRKRLIFISIILLSSTLGVWLILQSFKNQISYYTIPSKVISQQLFHKELKVGGIVTNLSFDKVKEEFVFDMIDSPSDSAIVIKSTDNSDANLPNSSLHSKMQVRYKGILPALFKEGQIAIVLGKLNTDTTFTARQVLAKHDENYRPPNKMLR